MVPPQQQPHIHTSRVSVLPEILHQASTSKMTPRRPAAMLLSGQALSPLNIPRSMVLPMDEPSLFSGVFSLKPRVSFRCMWYILDGLGSDSHAPVTPCLPRQQYLLNLHIATDATALERICSYFPVSPESGRIHRSSLSS